MSLSETDVGEKSDWYELGTHSLLLQANLRSLCVAANKDKRVRENTVLCCRIQGAMLQGSNLEYRLKELQYNFEKSANVWCSLACEYLWGLECCQLLVREPQSKFEQELLFKLREMQRLGEPTENCILALSDTSWFDTENSFELLQRNVDNLLERYSCLDELAVPSFHSALCTSICLDDFIDRKKKKARASTSREEMQADMEAWRQLVGRHLADVFAMASLADGQL